jgi:hypothetical protein
VFIEVCLPLTVLGEPFITECAGEQTLLFVDTPVVSFQAA